MNRPMLAGTLMFAFGAALIVPVIHQHLDGRPFSSLTAAVVAVAAIFIGLGGGLCAFQRSRACASADDALPAPVRAIVTATILFLAFCGLEFSDGLLRQHGRIFYWTSVLFLPALGLLYGLLSARRWAWWAARITTALAVLWFAAFIVLIPFADLRTDGVPVPWPGRFYMAGVTALFATTAACTFRSLGLSEARKHFESHTHS